MLDKFKALYLKKYNVTLTNEEATEMANGLVNLMEILVKPDDQHVHEGSNDETV